MSWIMLDLGRSSVPLFIHTLSCVIYSPGYVRGLRGCGDLELIVTAAPAAFRPLRPLRSSSSLLCTLLFFFPNPFKLDVHSQSFYTDFVVFLDLQRERPSWGQGRRQALVCPHRSALPHPCPPVPRIARRQYSATSAPGSESSATGLRVSRVHMASIARMRMWLGTACIPPVSACMC